MTCWKSSANVRPDPQTSQNIRAYCRPTLKSVTHLPVGVTFHQTILPGLLLYLMKGSFPRYSYASSFLVPVMCQGQSAADETSTADQTRRNSSADGTGRSYSGDAHRYLLLLHCTSPCPPMLPRHKVRQLSEMTGVATDRRRIPISKACIHRFRRIQCQLLAPKTDPDSSACR
jgi:hypothetical protein